MKHYFGTKEREVGPQEVFVQFDKGESETTYLLPLAPSLEIRNHSPDGFGWDYAGSGPAQLALAILLDHFDNRIGARALAAKLYQRFKDQFIATAGAVLDISESEIEVWVGEEQRKERELVN